MVLFFHAEPRAQSLFIPENGSYKYGLEGITHSFIKNKVSYVTLDARFYNPSFKYKLNRRKNEYQIKHWFQRDWYVMQDMFTLNPEAFIRSQGALTFNEAKRRQYAKFPFNKKRFYHHKSLPAMKEWGGLTHPPVKKLTMPLERYDASYRPLNYSLVSSSYFSPSLQLDIDRVSKSELTFGNELKSLADNEAFLMKKRLIRSARESILMSSLVFICDESTREVIDLLIQKHQQGVDVKIIADGFIGRILNHRQCLQTMRDAGIEVVESKDFFKHKLKTLYHTKTLVVDFNEAVAGGHNMIDADNLSRGTDFQNRDIDLYVKGPMVTDIAKQFVENWDYQATLNKKVTYLKDYKILVDSKLKLERLQGKRGQKHYSHILGRAETRMRGVCRFIKQAPYEDRHTIGKAYLKLLGQVTKHLAIADPVKSDTFVGSIADKPWLEKLDNFDMFNLLHLKVQSLAKAGKKIDYVTTNINMAGNENVAMMNERIKDQLNLGKDFLANWSLAKLIASNKFYGKPHYKNLMRDWMPFSNVHIWKHMSFMHSKIFYFDRIVSSIGSYNFQHNATDHSYESTAICMDEGLNAELDTIFVQDMANSIPLIFSELR
jgi:phosphatidylserine/phosphatidylglycerophosphate/cardiolipin synthase-like enzyme